MIIRWGRGLIPKERRGVAIWWWWRFHMRCRGVVVIRKGRGFHHRKGGVGIVRSRHGFLGRRIGMIIVCNRRRLDWW